MNSNSVECQDWTPYMVKILEWNFVPVKCYFCDVRNAPLRIQKRIIDYWQRLMYIRAFAFRYNSKGWTWLCYIRSETYSYLFMINKVFNCQIILNKIQWVETFYNILQAKSQPVKCNWKIKFEKCQGKRPILKSFH